MMTRDEAVAGGVALAAFACSAAHIYSVAYDYGNPAPIAALHPLGLDGLIYVGLRNVRRAPLAGWIAAGYGAVMSLVFNAASYADAQLDWRVMAAAMPLAMVLGFVVIHSAKPRKVETDPEVGDHLRESLAQARKEAEAAEVRRVQAEAEVETLRAELTREQARRRPETKEKAETTTAGRGVSAEMIAKVRETAEANPNATQKEIAQLIGTSDRTVRNAQAALAATNGKAPS